MTVSPIPKHHSTIAPYLVINDARRLIEFLKLAFHAQEISHTEFANGLIKNAELKIGDSMLMVADAQSYGPRPMTIHMYLENVDETYQHSLQAGALSLMEPTDQLYGDRVCGVEDFAGNHWWMATRIENVSGEEIQRRMAKENIST